MAKATNATNDQATEISITEVVELLTEYFEVDFPDGIDTKKELKIALAAASGQIGDDDDDDVGMTPTDVTPAEGAEMSTSRRRGVTLSTAGRRRSGRPPVNASWPRQTRTSLCGPILAIFCGRHGRPKPTRAPVERPALSGACG